MINQDRFTVARLKELVKLKLYQQLTKTQESRQYSADDRPLCYHGHLESHLYNDMLCQLTFTMYLSIG